MDYSTKTDREIDLLVEAKYKPMSDLALCQQYCNDPAAMWPIIIEKRISIIFDDLLNNEACSDFSVDRFSYGYSSKHWDDDKNPLRAAAIVYLMMED